MQLFTPKFLNKTLQLAIYRYNLNENSSIDNGKAHEIHEFELSVELTIMDEWKWNKLRLDGCSKELLDKFGEYIY